MAAAAASLISQKNRIFIIRQLESNFCWSCYYSCQSVAYADVFKHAIGTKAMQFLSDWLSRAKESESDIIQANFCTYPHVSIKKYNKWCSWTITNNCSCHFRWNFLHEIY